MILNYLLNVFFTNSTQTGTHSWCRPFLDGKTQKKNAVHRSFIFYDVQGVDHPKRVRVRKLRRKEASKVLLSLPISAEICQWTQPVRIERTSLFPATYRYKCNINTLSSSKSYRLSPYLLSALEFTKEMIFCALRLRQYRTGYARIVQHTATRYSETRHDVPVLN